MFNDSVRELPVQEGLTPNGLMVQSAQPEHDDAKMTVQFSLEIQGQAELEEKVARGEVVPVAQLQSDYAAPGADVNALVNWLMGQGFTIDHVSPDKTGVYATASVAQIESSLGVNMVRVTKDGVTYTAAQNAPSLPVDVGKGVTEILGLQPYRQAHKHFRMLPPRFRRDSADPAQDGIAPTPAVQNAPPYLVSEVLKAYDADSLGVTGVGQTIAILIDTFPNEDDLTQFWKQNGVPVVPGRVKLINVTNTSLAPPSGEETLDAEWASGIAPGANVRIYASGSLSFVDLDRALDRILADLADHPEMRQLSVSLGLGETYMAKGELTTQHQKYLQLAAAGVNVFVSSGDAGSNPDTTGHGSMGPLQAEYGASDPTVVGVGGTSLALAPDGSVAREIGWASGGGGKSDFFSRPSWQVAAGAPGDNGRLVPDVSLTADPNEGGFIVLNGQPGSVGGTSWSAPVWAGFCALMNEARAKAGQPPLPFLCPLIYPLAGSSCFRDIVKGSNGAYDAGPGYDLVTGIGVPSVRELIAALTKPGRSAHTGDSGSGSEQ